MTRPATVPVPPSVAPDRTVMLLGPVALPVVLLASNVPAATVVAPV